MPWAQLRADAMTHARTVQDNFSFMLAIGIGSLIFVEFTVKVAMVLRIYPVVGMPLPFFSHGGSSMATICVCLGLLMAINRDSMRQQNRA